jgi:ribosomal protein S18 acetylase RimI-like enzyme
VLVARADDRSVLGFAATQLHGRRLAIIGLAVDAKARRRGIGRALLARVAEAAAGADLRDVVLHVAVDNEPAIALYENEGFHREKRLRGFYRSGDAWLMVKTLSGPS